MIEVHISNECFELVQSKALLPFKNNGRPSKAGGWIIPLDDETVERLSRHQLAGETLSDAIFRILSIQSGSN
jgi:hypothetical protein